MNILVDIGHPAHVHLMRNAIHELQRKGHSVFVTCKEADIITQLLQHYGIEYISLGAKGKNMLTKSLKQVLFNWKIWRFAVTKHIDIATGTSVSIPIVSKLCRMKSVNLDDDDDEVQKIMVRFAHPFSDVRLTPSALRGHRQSPRAVFYNGTHELAYLHPHWFQPNPAVLEHAGLAEGEPFFILRLVAFNAYHDTHEGGIAPAQLGQLIDILKPHGRILITSEKELLPQFREYRLPVPPWEIHSLMAYSTLFVGDSQTMTSEAAILGIPAFKCNTFAHRLSVPNMLEDRYGLCHSYLPSEFGTMCESIRQTLATSPKELHDEWQRRRAHFLDEQVDVTAFLVDFLENYPLCRTR